MPLSTRESAKKVFTGKGSLEIPMLRKHLTRNADFTTFSSPERCLKRRSKSLSDLADRTSRIQKYLDRRRVIHMDPNDKDCCSHTELAPSTMMTLALELHDPRHSKATHLFKEARSRFVSCDDVTDSILPQLWVVPKGVSFDGDSEVTKLASHLQPSQEPISGITLRSKKTSSVKTNTNRHATVLQSEGKGICRRSGFAYPTVRCIPMSDHGTQLHNLAYVQGLDVTISKDDIEKDLKAITVTDLIGSPDTPFTDTENESIDMDEQCNIGSKVATKKKEEYVSLELKRVDTATKVKTRPNRTIQVENPFFEDESMDGPTATEVAETGHNRMNRVELGQPNKANSKTSDTSFAVTAEPSCSLSDIDSQSRKRSLSTASSLTTVSSLSSSSLSVGSIDANKHSGEIPHNKPATRDTSSPFIVKQPAQTGRVEKVVAASKAQLNGHAQQLPLYSPIPSSKAPAPPKRSKSIQVMERIRKTGKDKELSTRAKRFATDCGNYTFVQRKSKIKIPSASMSDNTIFDESNRKSLLTIDDKDENQIMQNIHVDCDAERSIVLKSATDAHRRERTGNTTASSRASQSGDSVASNKMHTADRVCQPHGKGYSGVDDIAKSKYCQRYEYQMPTLCIPIEFQIKPDKSVEVLQNVANNMERERWFRNGQISVVDGSRVTLARQSSSSRANGSNARPRRHSVTPFARAPHSLFMSDIIKEVRPSSTKPWWFEEHIVPVQNIEDFEGSPPTDGKQANIDKGLGTNQLHKDCAAFQPIAAKSQTLGCTSDRVQPKFENKMKYKQATNGVDESTPTRDVIKSTTNESRNRITSMDGYQRSPSYVNSVKRDSPFKPVLVTSACYITTSSGTKTAHSTPNDHSPYKSSRNASVISKTSMNFNKSPRPYFSVKSERHVTPHAKMSGEINGNTSSPTESITPKEAVALRCPKQMAIENSTSERKLNAVHGEGGGKGAQIYSSSIKIVVGSNTRTTAKRYPSSSTKNVRESNLQSEGSRTTRSKTRVEKSDNGQAEISPDMKQSEEQAASKLETPMHSSVDESDFSGVVDGPTKNVKEIRAMFKVRDHANYAKPKQMLKKSSPPTTLPKPRLRPEKSPNGSNRNSAEVAQQVMGLFKGAIEIEEVAQDSNLTAPTEDKPEKVNSNPQDAQVTLQATTANTNEGSSPHEEVSHNVSISDKNPSITDHNHQDGPYVEIIENPTPVGVANGHERKSSVKQEKVLAESYDESLDQFYDVFDQLTTR